MTRIEVVAAIIIRDGRILLTQRPPGAAFAYSWCTPGGKVEPGEVAARALPREILEEVDAELEDELSNPTAIVELDGPAVSSPLRVTFYRARLAATSREPRPLEGQGLGWFSARELESLPLTPADEAQRTAHIAMLRGEMQ